jgi:hypothetical protein
MTHRFQWLKGGAAVLVVAAATITPITGRAATAVYVADVEQLYAAVNSPANVGASVILAPGSYSLSSTNSAGTARPNGGRLDLQQDMSLYGVGGDRAAVVIDATALPQSSFTAPFGRTGVIRTGRGRNAVEWLTIAGNPLAAAAVETDKFSTPETQLRVAHVVAGNSARGVDVRNVGADMIGRRIDAEIVDSDFFGGVEGIRIANFAGADEGDIRVVMSGNRSYDNTLGCIVENNRSSRATIHVRSSGDRFEGNGLGCQIGGGLVAQPTGLANFNSTVFEGHGTKFINNNKRTDFCTACMGPVFTDFGGVLVAAGDALLLDHSTWSNTVSVRLWGCKVSENLADSGIDFQAFGARSEAPSGEIAGADNHATIELHGVSARVDVVAVDDNAPNDPSPSNTVTVFRSPSAP